MPKKQAKAGKKPFLPAKKRVLWFNQTYGGRCCRQGGRNFSRRLQHRLFFCCNPFLFPLKSLVMAKKSTIAKNNRRRELAEKFEPLRRKLRREVVNESLSPEERLSAGLKLQKLPKSAARFRVVNRCRLTGRGRGNFRKFGLSRMMFRELAHKGLLPGVTKSSW